MAVDHFKFDYDLSSIKKIKTHDFKMWVTPRYISQYENNEYESFSSEIINNYLKDESTFVDVGAHYGYYSILASKAKKNVEIISIEPVEENFQILRKNLKLNNIINNHAYNVALSDKNSVKKFNVTEASDSSGFYDHSLTKSKKKIDIETRTLDSLLLNRKIDFIKIDVEGHEVPVLSGMKATIINNKNLKMLIEFNPKAQENAGLKPDDLINIIEKLGFEVYLLDEMGHRYYRLTKNKYRWNEIVEINNYEAYYSNLFCIKKEESLLTTYFSHSSNLEGAERSLLEILEKLPEYGALSHLICPSQGPLNQVLDGKAVAQDTIPYSWWVSGDERQNEISMYSSILSQGKFVRELEKINPHVIFTNTAVIPWGALSALFLEKPHLWYIHEFVDLDHGMNFLTSTSEAKIIINKLSDKIICNSQAVKKHFFEKKSNYKVSVHYYGFDIERYLALETTDIYKKNNSLKIILVGSMRKSKGQIDAVKAIVKLTERGYKVELLLLGKFKNDDSYCKKLKKLVKIKNLTNVYFKNFVNNPYPYIKQANVLLMCSKEEAFGRVTVEGMLLRKVVIGARSGATPEIIQNNKTGLLYQAGNVADLVNKIEILLKNPEKIKVLSDNGYIEASKKYTSKNYIKSIYSILIHLKNKKNIKLHNTKGLIKNIIQEMQRDHSELWVGIEKQRSVINSLSIENSNIRNMLYNIEAAKFYKLWQAYCYYRDKIFRQNK